MSPLSFRLSCNKSFIHTCDGENSTDGVAWSGILYHPYCKEIVKTCTILGKWEIVDGVIVLIVFIVSVNYNSFPVQYGFQKIFPVSTDSKNMDHFFSGFFENFIKNSPNAYVHLSFDRYTKAVLKIRLFRKNFEFFSHF